MSIVLYFVMMKLMPPEMEEVQGGREAIASALAELGPVKAAEWRLLAISATLLFLVVDREDPDLFEHLHHHGGGDRADVPALCRRDGLEQAQPRVPWGTIVLFGVGISLGTALLQTKAAGWLANIIVQNLGLANASAFTILALLSLFLIVVHLGFASATALASAMIPIMIAVLQSVQTPGLNLIGMTMILQFVVSFGFILPVNAPQNMVAYGTETFVVRDFVRSGLVLTAVGYALVLLLGASYWQWMGYLTK